MNWKVKPWVRPLKTNMKIPKPGNQQWMVSGICFYGHATTTLIPYPSIRIFLEYIIFILYWGGAKHECYAFVKVN